MYINYDSGLTVQVKTPRVVTRPFKLGPVSVGSISVGSRKLTPEEYVGFIENDLGI